MNRARWVIPCLAGLVALSIAAPAHAQFYGGGFGGGFYGNGSSIGGFAPPHSIGGYYPMPYSTIFPGVRGGYGYGYPGFYGGPGFGGYGPYGYGGYGGYGGMPNTNVVQQQAPTMIQSQTVIVPSNPQVVHTGETIKLICPKVATGQLTYSLNGSPYTIQPGYSQTFRDDRTWKLEFQRAGEGSTIVGYTLKPGTYKFGVGAEGWELRQVINELPPAPQPTPLPAAPNASPATTSTSVQTPAALPKS